MMIFPRRRYSSGSQWGLFRWTDVVIGGELYLRRLHLLQTPWFAVMLHWIFRADPQPDMHDHPVSFLSVVLRGGYTEQVPIDHGPFFLKIKSYHHRKITTWNLIRTTDRHQIMRLCRTPTVTLCFAGPKRRDWGFHTPRGWVPWREYKG